MLMRNLCSRPPAFFRGLFLDILLPGAHSFTLIVHTPSSKDLCALMVKCLSPGRFAFSNLFLLEKDIVLGVKRTGFSFQSSYRWPCDFGQVTFSIQNKEIGLGQWFSTWLHIRITAEAFSKYLSLPGVNPREPDSFADEQDPTVRTFNKLSR